MCDGLGQNEIERVGKISGLVLSLLWTKVHEILRQYSRHFILSNALIWLSISRFFLQIFAIKSRSRRKTEQMQKFLALQFFWRDDPNFSTRQLVSAIYRPPFGKVWLEFCLLISVCETWQWSRKQNLRRVGKSIIQFEAVSGPKFMSFWHDVGDPV